jgi:hypothetical protein
MPGVKSLLLTTARPSVASASVRSDSMRLRNSAWSTRRHALPDLCIEHGQASRVDRVEADVEPIRVVEEVVEGLPVVEVGEHLTIFLARLAGVSEAAAVRTLDVGRQSTVGPDAERPWARWAVADTKPREVQIRPMERPPVADGDDRLSLLADAAEMNRQILERVEHAPLAAAGDHLLGHASVEIRRLHRRLAAGPAALLVEPVSHAHLAGIGKAENIELFPFVPISRGDRAAPSTSASSAPLLSSSCDARTRGRPPTCPAS